VPSTTAVGFLVNPKNPNSQSDSRDGQAAALALGLRLLVQTVTSEREFEAAFAGFDQQRVDAIIVSAPAGGAGGCSFRLVRERGGDDALKAFAVYNDSTCPKPVISPSTSLSLNTRRRNSASATASIAGQLSLTNVSVS
jgi:hypothetical protein